MNLKTRVIQYLKENPINDSAKNKYAEVSRKFNVRKNVISRWWWQAKNEVNGNTVKKTKSPVKILLFDIETSPFLGYFWNAFNTNISQDDIIQDWKLLCYSAKWLFEDKIISDKLTSKELKSFDDKRLTESLWKLIDEADICITHNGVRFDHKRANSKFLEHDMVPPSPYLTIDTCLSARKHFGEVSNRLDWWARKFGVNGKTPSAGLWKRIMLNNDYEALVEMDGYCKNDVKILEDVYLVMRPYIQPHPNVGLFMNENTHTCPSCGGTHVTKLEKDYKTTVSSYEAYRCDDCGAVSRSKVKTNKNSKTLSSIPQR